MKRYFFIFLILTGLQSCSTNTQHNQTTILENVLNSKILRVGTTGDYKPFTYLNQSHYEGIDIELAKNLAKSLNAKVKFVKTSWPTMRQDLKENKFDILMGGITKKLNKQQIGLFSSGYYTSGKTPIARCKDRDKYKSLGQIDRQNVKVIVNPGGTNQKFVKKHIKSAHIIVYNDNNTIFKQISERKADVMITDSIEVQLQSKLIPTLCATMPAKTFDKSEKAYLMPRDLIWREYVNAWLKKRMLDGTIKKLFSKYQ